MRINTAEFRARLDAHRDTISAALGGLTEQACDVLRATVVDPTAEYATALLDDGDPSGDGCSCGHCGDSGAADETDLDGTDEQPSRRRQRGSRGGRGRRRRAES